jgi:hypothetical protein
MWRRKAFFNIRPLNWIELDGKDASNAASLRESRIIVELDEGELLKLEHYNLRIGTQPQWWSPRSRAA